MSEITVVLWQFNRRYIPIFDIEKYRGKPLVLVSYHRDYDDPVVSAYVTDLPEDIEDSEEKRMALAQWTREQARERQYSEPEGSPTHTLMKSIFEAIVRSTRVEIDDPSRLPPKYR
ncbi:hypothetical protein SB768_08005 [Burkholderia sp. SIMBA_043]|uniref:hypothetical protein n=1 Tax=Burkholderia TaxID=32008 RepID=UPI0005D8BB9B|nr:hypothetical protein [Burkholderia vietnamiensis]AJY07545.1 hypothetical protein AK36_2048 [Burkholderia vietnamiensis LMG 10929]UBI27547.1 hypothetical protein LA325_15305 [Burkholderia vietnamiensis]